MVMGWKLQSDQRPERDVAAAESPATRKLWLLWDQLQIVNGVLYNRGEATDGTASKLLTRVHRNASSRTITTNIWLETIGKRNMCVVLVVSTDMGTGNRLICPFSS